ncbi:MAG: glycosyltransferase, partial [Bacteroidales bacterium]|nr:glycosyltransferase [Bacteroidales bacterium]
MTQIPFVSVIIPTYNENDLLKLCLDSLSNQSFSLDKYEIIVVNNSLTSSPEIVVNGYKNTRLITEEKKGSYAARNKGIHYAKGEILVFTDSDCIPSFNWLENGVNSLMNNENCGIVGGNVELFYHNPSYLTMAELYEKTFSFKQKSYVENINFSVTANLFTFQKVFDKVGLFNNSLQSSGDLEWGNRVYSAGFKLVYSDEAIVKHPARRKLRDLIKKHKRIVRGQHAIDFNRTGKVDKDTPYGELKRYDIYKWAIKISRKRISFLNNLT